jgi:hypothetical protein
MTIARRQAEMPGDCESQSHQEELHAQADYPVARSADGRCQCLCCSQCEYGQRGGTADAYRYWPGQGQGDRRLPDEERFLQVGGRLDKGSRDWSGRARQDEGRRDADRRDDAEGGRSDRGAGHQGGNTPSRRSGEADRASHSGDSTSAGRGEAGCCDRHSGDACGTRSSRCCQSRSDQGRSASCRQHAGTGTRQAGRGDPFGAPAAAATPAGKAEPAKSAPAKSTAEEKQAAKQAKKDAEKQAAATKAEASAAKK